MIPSGYSSKMPIQSLSASDANAKHSGHSGKPGDFAEDNFPQAHKLTASSSGAQNPFFRLGSKLLVHR